MTNLREAAQMALDALEQVQEADTAGATPKMVMEARKLYEPTITALRAALAQPEQEPVAWYDSEHGEAETVFSSQRPPWEGNWKPLYNAPPQREWQGLTEMEVMDICNFAKGQNGFFFVREVEAKLKEKNGNL